MKTYPQSISVKQKKDKKTSLYLTLPELELTGNFDGELYCYQKLFLPRVERELHGYISRLKDSGTPELSQMIAYHLGKSEGKPDDYQGGKRIRPLLVLLTHEALGGDWEKALPAAAAVEFLHNFSLIHDDIQDGSEMRRGRPTVWKRWGIAQAINAGDCLFALANIALSDLSKNYSLDITLKAAKLLSETSVRLSEGQYLDIAFENENSQTPDAYLQMITNKTAALIGMCTELGAILAGANGATQRTCRNIGERLGMAYQIQDDVLGIWGSEIITGKPNDGDIFTRKKTLPIIYGLEAKGEFSKRWKDGQISKEDIPKLAYQLELEGGRMYSEGMRNQQLQQALINIQNLEGKSEARNALSALLGKLLSRKS